MPNNNKNEFDNKKPSQTQEKIIYKSLNDIINQSNISSKTESNNSDKDKEKK